MEFEAFQKKEKIEKVLKEINNIVILKNYKTAEYSIGLIKNVNDIISSILDKEGKEDDKIEKVRELIKECNSLNNLYKAFFQKINEFSHEFENKQLIVNNNECIVSNEIVKIVILKKIIDTLNKNDMKETAEKFNSLKIDDKYHKIKGMIERCINIVKELRLNKDFDDFLDIYNISTLNNDDNKIKELLDNIKKDKGNKKNTDTNELRELIDKVTRFSVKIVGSDKDNKIEGIIKLLDEMRIKELIVIN